MGEVYEVRDRELNEQVALKTVRAEMAKDSHALERLKREIHLARKVTHPNVCRVFDVGYHDEGAARLPFVTMELLNGETLSDRIARGRVPIAEALPIVRQVADGLAAAHEAGIVHRDLKPSNILLIDRGNGLRAVVTDFGIAKGISAEEPSASLTSPGTVVGSLAYMAPELFDTGEPSPASDIYALGVVIYEMVTGTWPIADTKSVYSLLQKVQEGPPPPRELVSDLDPRWDRAIRRALDKDPAARFTTASELARALIRGHAGRRRRRTWPWLAAAFAGAAVGSAGYLYYVQTRETLVPVTTGTRPTVAVLGFRNLVARPDKAWVSTALAEMLNTELAAGDALRVIAGESVARLKVDLALKDTDAHAPDTLAKIRSLSGSDHVVLGSYLALGSGEGGLRLDLRVQDTRTGETIFSAAESGSESELVKMLSRLGEQVRTRMGVAPAAEEAMAAARAALPQNSKAMRLYAEGLSHLRRFDAVQARALFEAAVAEEPEHPLPRTALAVAWKALGHDASARAAAEGAFSRAGGLARRDRLYVEAVFHEMAAAWDQAVELYQALWTVYPDELEYGLRLAETQAAAGQGEESLGTIAALRLLPSPARDDPRVDLAEAAAAEAVADLRRMRDAASRAIAKGEVLGARLIAAHGYILEGRAAWRLGEAQAALNAHAHAQRIYAEAGDRRGVATAARERGRVVWRQGKLDEAKKLFAEALVLAREVGDIDAQARALNNLAIIANDERDLAGARTRYSEAQALFERTGNQQALATVLNNLGALHTDAGEVETASVYYNQALAAYRHLGDRLGEAMALRNLGKLRHAAGELGDAEDLLREARVISIDVGDKSGLADALDALAELALDRRGEDAEQYTRAAIDSFTEAGDTAEAARARLRLGELALRAQRYTEAEQAARETLAAARQDVGTELKARAMLIQSLTRQGKLDEAQRVIAEMTPRLVASPLVRRAPLAARCDAARAAAMVWMALGRHDDALATLTPLVDETNKLGQVIEHLELQLVLAHARLAARHDDALALLDNVRQEAERMGLVHIAAKAAALLER